MRVVNQKFETITEYDLSKGELVEVTTVREDMTPVDNVNKFAPDDADWEQAMMYVPYTEFEESEPVPDDDSAIWDELDAAYQEGVDSV